jgi:hypothetical protein
MDSPLLTDAEMDIFLESIGGLENGFYPDREPILSNNYFQCNTGWNSIIKKLIEDLIKIGWDKQICQVKEKFGQLCFYTNSLPDGGFDLIRQAEKDSICTCEMCGFPGKRRTDLSWIKTLCEDHYTKRKNHANS